MKVYQVTEGVFDRMMQDLSNTVNSVLGNNTTDQQPEPVQAQPSQADQMVQAETEKLYPRIDSAVNSGDKRQLLRLIVGGATYVLQQIPNANTISAHARDKYEEEITRRIIARMARVLDTSQVGGSRRTDWVAFARSNPNRFVNIIADPTQASELR